MNKIILRSVYNACKHGKKEAPLGRGSHCAMNDFSTSAVCTLQAIVFLLLSVEKPVC